MHGEADTSLSARRTLWFVTQNAHKYEEARRTLDPHGIKIRRLDSPKTEIQSTNLDEIAKHAAEEAARKHNRTVVVEDSGLFVKALHGFPGPYSSYVHATIGLEGLLRLMSREQRRGAFFQASLALASPRDPTRQFSGRVHGIISHESAGTKGFGFDPIFIPKGTKMTFAQGGNEFKDKYSHRARAFRKLALWYRQVSSGRRQLTDKRSPKITRSAASGEYVPDSDSRRRSTYSAAEIRTAHR